MKIAKNVSFRTVTFGTVKIGAECKVDNLTVVKVRPKVAMTTRGQVMNLPDFTQVKIKIKA